MADSVCGAVWRLDPLITNQATVLKGALPPEGIADNENCLR